jgi:glycosyltransferase involved in cell wall biosynthesis
MLDSGGIGTYIACLLRELAAGPFKLRLIVPRKAAQRHSWLSGFELIFCDAPIYSVQEQLQLPMRIPACDLFWSPHFNIPLTPIRAKKRLTTIHDAYHLAFYKELRPLEKLYAKQVIGQALRRSDAVVTDSVFSKRELIRYAAADPARLFVIPLGPGLFPFPHETSVEALREKYRLPEPFILFVGNVKPHKNLRGLVRAAQGQAVVVAGKRENLIRGESWESVPAHVAFLGDVPQEDLATLYRTASVYACPSFYEGFGLPPLEAMGCGCPVVASKAASLPEVCGEAAEYVDPHDPRDISSGIAKALSRREELVQRGFVRVRDYSWERAAQAHAALMERLCR